MNLSWNYYFHCGGGVRSQKPSLGGSIDFSGTSLRIKISQVVSATLVRLILSVLQMKVAVVANAFMVQVVLVNTSHLVLVISAYKGFVMANVFKWLPSGGTCSIPDGEV